jgi:tetratricopeptide (TPR) repeat protein/tRNA A-37 threonylcarbamoyl transferase component Bud32
MKSLFCIRGIATMAKGQPVRFGKYVLLDKVATGGMAELYRAKITGIQGFEKLIAIKRILPHLATQEELVSSFIDEAKLAALLHHQNIVQIYDFGCIEDSYYIAMEYLLGKDLRLVTRKAALKDKPISLEFALYVVSRICAGLDYSHSLKDFQGTPLNIIHRDISPPNVLITYDGNVKIVDFGIAKAATQSHLTQAGMIKGKVAYMSPEQAQGKVIDHRSDIYSAGIILYELLTGRQMFQGGDTLQMLALVRKGKFTQAREVKGNLPDKLYGILDRALAKNREMRYQSVGDMLADLEECMYQMSMRYGSRELSEYLKILLEEEITADKTALLEAERGVEAVEERAAWQVPPREEKSRELEDDTVAAEGEPPSVEARAKTRGRGLWYAGGAAALILVGLLFVVIPRERSGSIPGKEAVSQPKKEQVEKAVSSPTSPQAEEKPSRPGEPGMNKFTQGMAALEQKRFAEATLLFEGALVANPSLMDKVSRPLAQALRGQAGALGVEDNQKAQELLVKAVGLEPDNAQGHFQLAGLHLKGKDYAKAIDSYQRGLKQEPKSSDALFNLGYAYAVTKDYAKAEDVYTRAVNLNPPYLDEALFNLAMVQVKLGKRDQSVKSLERAIQVNPKNEGAKQYLQLLKQGT